MFYWKVNDLFRLIPYPIIREQSASPETQSDHNTFVEYKYSFSSITNPFGQKVAQT